MKRYRVTIHVCAALVEVVVHALDETSARRAVEELFDASGAWVEVQEELSA